MMQEDQKGCKKNIRAQEQINAARTKQNEDKEEDTGIRPAGREKNTRTRRKKQRDKYGEKKTSKQDNKCHCYRFRAPPIELNEKNKQKLLLTVGFRATVAHVPRISRTGTLPHDLPFRFCFRRQLYQSGCHIPPRPPGFPLSPLLASSAAWRS